MMYFYITFPIHPAPSIGCFMIGSPQRSSSYFVPNQSIDRLLHDRRFMTSLNPNA